MSIIKNENISKLLQSPIYAMSLGSKELFHSNFWAWLIETDTTFAKAFFSDIEVEKIQSLGREDRSRDITIYLNDGSSYVIENKIKSLPYNEQLIRYEKNTKGFKIGLITGLKETLNLYDNNLWSFLSYKEIAKRILFFLESSTNDIILKNKDIIAQYCIDISLLSDVVSSTLNQNENHLEYHSKLHQIRFDDVYKKFKADDFLTKCLRNNKELHYLKPEGYDLHIGMDYSNKHAIIDVRFIIKDKLCIGVQIEEEQFRIIAERRIANKCDEVFQEFLQYGWFDEIYDKHNNKIIFGYETKMKPNHNKKYNKYQTSSYSFVYQYFNLNHEIKNYDALTTLILTFMKKAKTITNML